MVTTISRHLSFLLKPLYFSWLFVQTTFAAGTTSQLHLSRNHFSNKQDKIWNTNWNNFLMNGTIPGTMKVIILYLCIRHRCSLHALLLSIFSSCITLKRCSVQCTAQQEGTSSLHGSRPLSTWVKYIKGLSPGFVLVTSQFHRTSFEFPEMYVTVPSWRMRGLFQAGFPGKLERK